MKILVLGSGVIGVTTAHYLAKQGFEVTVVDRQPAAGMETSYANAGQISPGYSTPWAAPGIPLKALKWLLQADAPLRIRPDGTVFQWKWLLQMLVNCGEHRYAVNKERMLRLAEYSRDCLRELRAETGLSYEGRQRGTLQVFRSQQRLDALEKDLSVLTDAGVRFEVLRPQDLGTYEPALARRERPLAGGLHLPGDETGDCQLFTTRLAQHAERTGVNFRFGANVGRLRIERKRLTGVEIDGVFETVDQVVVAMGCYSREIGRQAGIELPVYPLKGYSLTMPIRNPTAAPQSTVMDETYKIAVTRFDDRIRVGGMAEVAGHDLRLDPNRQRLLERVVDDLFPGAADLPSAQLWTGLRPMTPDGTPIVGATRIAGLWLNTGHGTLGWTMACGSGRLLADLIAGRKPDICTDGLDVTRYERGKTATRSMWTRPIGGEAGLVR